MIAVSLSRNQRFEDAQQWFHYIFDPTDASSHPAPQRYWRTKPFFETTAEEYYNESIPNLQRFLANRGDAAAYAALTPAQRQRLETLEAQVREWRADPFKPHLVARLRTTAYQKCVLMKYLDNLIGWGDQLYRRDTMESISEATQLYVLAADLLGKRPPEIPPRAVPTIETYNSIEPKLNSFSNALVRIEELVPPSAGAEPPGEGEPPVTLPTMLYFCVPKSERLMAYWDTVADRLFKIRHCMNIEGVVRPLSLFAPPIDPALLDSSYIRFGYWDSLRKGLLAGERLMLDIKRMEAAYLEQNRQEYEITKHVSLAQLDSLALVQLRQTGSCFFRVPELLFALDHPGHYMRRIKSLAVTIPCVTGPYVGVPCALRLLSSEVRHSPSLNGGLYARQDDDPRFRDSIGNVQTVITSTAQNDPDCSS